MAYIEPRLMHLLNETLPKSFDLPPLQNALDLPPLQGLDATKPISNSISLPPFDPDANIVQVQSIQSLGASIGKERPARRPSDGSVSRKARHDGNSLRMILGSPKVNSFQTASHDTVNVQFGETDSSITIKRFREAPSDEFVQLPQPLKRQKSSQHVVPPIINGLHEPPPNAALFPPMNASSTFDGSNYGPLIFEVHRDHDIGEDRSSTLEAPEGVSKAKRKVRRVWSEQETKCLLLGVSRHGIGRWTAILQDPDYVFENRQAGDLKDRFRICCPAGLGHSRDQAVDAATSSKAGSTAIIAVKVSATSRDMAALCETRKRQTSSEPGGKDTMTTDRTHRLDVKDLENLGIQGPFKESQRRRRHPFSEQEDEEILEGLRQHGPVWSKIQRHTGFHLTNRRPTDLRDRVRNKYPEIFAKLDKCQASEEQNLRSSSLLEPAVNTIIEHALSSTIKGTVVDVHSSQDPFKDGFLDFAEQTDLPEPATSALSSSAGEMDISRLLLGG